MEYEFAGLPLHVLLVHAVIVLVPLLALLLVVIAAWRAARRVLWLPALIGAAVLLPLGLVTIEAGEWLEERVPQTPLIQAHTDIGESIVPWLVALLVLAAVIAAWAVFEMVSARRAGDGEPQRPGRGVRIAVGAVLTLAALGVAIGSTWTSCRSARPAAAPCGRARTATSRSRTEPQRRRNAIGSSRYGSHAARSASLMRRGRSVAASTTTIVVTARVYSTRGWTSVGEKTS